MRAETLSYSHGRYTDKTVTRAGKIVGAIGKALDAAYHENICETDINESYRHPPLCLLYTSDAADE